MMFYIFVIILLILVKVVLKFYPVSIYLIKSFEMIILSIISIVYNIKYNKMHQPENNNIASLIIATENVGGAENLEIISNKKINTKVSNLKLTACPQKPLVVCLTWLGAKRKNVLKYIHFYLEHGFDVLNVSVSPWQLLWPMEGIQLVARDVLEFLNSNENYSPLIIHGFSVGAYLWGEMLLISAHEKDRYKNVLNNICGLIWDSAVDVSEIQLGVPVAVFPKNKVMQSILQQYITYRLKILDKVVTSQYMRGSQMFHRNPIKAPVLILVSKCDPIGTVSANMKVRELWKSLEITVHWKCFEKSPHVDHFRHYPKEYESEINAFLGKLSLTLQSKKVQVKI